MTKFSFADRYAEAGLAPGAQVIGIRQAPAERIVNDIPAGRALDLIGVYYGSPDLDLGWLRDEFAAEDAAFSLVNNGREIGVLAAVMLDQLVSAGNAVAILGLLAGSVVGNRRPAQAEWLLVDAEGAFGRQSVTDRKPAAIETKVAHSPVPKLADEIAAVPQNDWAALLAMLGKIRSEALSSARTTAGQTTAALTALNRQVRFMREESQMLWWLVGGHSRSLERSFAQFGPQQAAIVGAADLGALTTVSQLGPVAAPAMLERVVAMAEGGGSGPSGSLSSAIDDLAPEDLQRLPVLPDTVPDAIAPVTAGIALARIMGQGAWHARFRERTGLDASMEFGAADLAHQLYREHLLGQLL